MTLATFIQDAGKRSLRRAHRQSNSKRAGIADLDTMRSLYTYFSGQYEPLSESHVHRHTVVLLRCPGDIQHSKWIAEF